MAYLVSVNVLAIAFGYLLIFTGSGGRGVAECLRISLATIWASNNPLGYPEERTAFYAIGLIEMALSVVLPLFLLGGFVFKLFQHDPIRWRRIISLYDYNGVPVLAFRFYNRTRSRLAGIQVQIFAEITWSREAFREQNVPLQTIRSDGTLQAASAWGVCSPGTPFLVRAPLSGDKTAIQWKCSPTVGVVDGIEACWESLRFVASVTGVSLVTGQPFVSVIKYQAHTDIALGVPCRLAAAKGRPPTHWRNWEHFDSNALLFLFLCNMPLNPRLISSAPGGDGLPGEGPLAATLEGYERDSSLLVPTFSPVIPNRSVRDTKPFEDIVDHVVTRVEAGRCVGAVIGVVEGDLVQLQRSVPYNLVDVSDKVTWSAKPMSCTVYAIVSQQTGENTLDDSDGRFWDRLLNQLRRTSLLWTQKL